MSPAEDVLLGTANATSEPLLLVCSIFEDQRPLKGAAGVLDWRLRGFLSRFVASGRISGVRDELVYVPIKHRESVRHLLLVGLGDSADKHGASGAVMKKIAQTAENLSFRKVAISRSSFSAFDESEIQTAFQNIKVEFIA